MIDSHTDFPRHALEHPSPGGMPILNFTEFSMYAMEPWGGFGANPMPATIQQRWDLSQHIFAGGFPYSEGIYEDINKAILLQLYWRADRPAMDIVREYAAYEFSPDVADDVAKACAIMEECQEHYVDRAAGTYRLPKLKRPERYLDILRSAERDLGKRATERWRWRVLWLRASLDAELQASGGVPTDRSDECFTELTRIYHADNAEPWMTPPSRATLR